MFVGVLNWFGADCVVIVRRSRSSSCGLLVDLRAGRRNMLEGRRRGNKKESQDKLGVNRQEEEGKLNEPTFCKRR